MLTAARLLRGMSCPGRIYGAPTPFSDESFSSWLLRLSAYAHLSTRFLRRLFDLKDCVDWLDFDGKRIPEAAPLRIHSVTAVPLQALRTMLPSPFGSPLAMPELAHLTRLPRGGARYAVCPICLVSDQNPYIRKSWRLAHHMVCDRHDCLLRPNCYYCREPLDFSQYISHRFPGDQSRGAMSFRCPSCKRSLTVKADVLVDHVAVERLRAVQCNLDRILSQGYLQHPRLGTIPASSVVSQYCPAPAAKRGEACRPPALDLRRSIGPFATLVNDVRAKLHQI